MLNENKYQPHESVGGDELPITSSEFSNKSTYWKLNPNDKIKINLEDYGKFIVTVLGFDKTTGRTMIVKMPDNTYTLLDALINGGDVLKKY